MKMKNNFIKIFEENRSLTVQNAKIKKEKERENIKRSLVNFKNIIFFIKSITSMIIKSFT